MSRHSISLSLHCVHATTDFLLLPLLDYRQRNHSVKGKMHGHTPALDEMISYALIIIKGKRQIIAASGYFSKKFLGKYAHMEIHIL